MKRIFLIVLLLVLPLLAKTEWVDPFDAYDEAKAQNKNVLVMLSMKGCPGCEYMEDVVFENREVAKKLQENFILVHLDVREDSIPEKFKYFATPTFYFVDAEENILKRLNGGKHAKDFLKTLEEMKK